MTNSKASAAVMGLGLMGSGIAKQLLANGFELSVYNRSPAKAAALVERGARLAASPADAAQGADFVISMVADDQASRSVWAGTDGALNSLKEGAVAIESSTLSVDWVKELAALAAGRGREFIDAPVTGSRSQAEAGELKFLAGGSPEAIAKAAPVLEAMGTLVTRLGPVGSGALLKIINNFLCGVQVASLAEAIALIERSGLDLEQAVAVLTSGAAGSPLVRTVSQRMVDCDYEPNFVAALMAKDLTYAAKTFADHGVDLRSAEAARERFQAAVEQGLANKDIAAIVEPMRSRSGSAGTGN